MIIYLSNFVCPNSWSEKTALAERMLKETVHKYRTAQAERNQIEVDVGTQKVLGKV